MYSESQTYSNRPDRVAQLAEHWASIPKVVGSIPTVARHIFQACSVWTFLKLGKEMQINHHSSKERTKMSKIAKFAKNIALQSLQILYTFVLRAEIATIFWPKCGSNCQFRTHIFIFSATKYIFRILQHFATKLCNFTNFSMLFPGIYFFLPS